MNSSTLAISWIAPLGRVLMAWIFLEAGVGKILAPAITANYMATGGLPASEMLAIGAGAFELVTGIMIAVGWKARAVALALVVFTLLATVLYHNYWSAPAEQAFIQQLLFSKNIAIVGGLILMMALGAGRFSIDTYFEERPSQLQKV